MIVKEDRNRRLRSVLDNRIQRAVDENEDLDVFDAYFRYKYLTVFEEIFFGIMEMVPISNVPIFFKDII